MDACLALTFVVLALVLTVADSRSQKIAWKNRLFWLSLAIYLVDLPFGVYRLKCGAKNKPKVATFWIMQVVKTLTGPVLGGYALWKAKKDGKKGKLDDLESISDSSSTSSSVRWKREVAAWIRGRAVFTS